ncbi:MAG: 4a-hydroxytetrahydrobiopterin dehydratase [Gemmatimonadetes bacterium]|jgi:4a-hydroxytetrahydrobiopterin dehydratase|nr:4a-hydroxytetrahydrobiopterin dehydratase [Gemmatimonadota bacterium]MBP9107161.1 4a-hydroxytetrahydrobiopterin dehydratase [Gemmatimonadaceae bacterium]MBK6454647.1 4a-hydroxytetrahydrobiopterin dehydratase [Gemmatimonadota bacterium]MBK6840851.1 4a-hydroxytetrahydrobiopterin dehydratase [Gemmatimonadota bacterium]MBK7834529.1 4a-hydroxytetrahydrobiopterin dehydratase [Gemmatimonadota bacterium]
MPASPLLSDIEIQRELGSLPGWARRGGTLVKTYTFPAFPAGIDWIRRAADAAESMSHHPDIDIRYTRITVTLSTHDSGGITTKDLALARALDAL